MKRVDSDALGVVTQALGMTGKGAPVTEFLDGQLDQTLEVGPIVRRGRTLAGTEGLFTGILRNIHTDAESLLSQFTPYAAPVGTVAPYPAVMPRQYDLWLLGAGLRRISGGGTVSAILDLEYQTQGFGIDDSGVAVVVVRTQVLAFWDAVVTEGISFGLMGTLGPYANIGLRMPRDPGTLLTFRSTSSITETLECQVIIGMFPTALGQDGQV